MGVFYETVPVINRTPIDLTVTFDGQCKTLKPGTNAIPAMTVPYAKNQNPVMGSQDPNNPHISGARYLIGVPGEDLPADCEPLTEAEWAAHLGEPTRENSQQAFEEKYGGDPRAKLVVHGKGRKTVAQSRYEAGGNVKGNSTFENDK
jgi:hypothetical protein